MAEKTLIIIKPDGVQRHMIGQIISRFEAKGFKPVAGKFMWISPELAQQHYAVHKEKPFFQAAVKYISASPVIVMVWSGPDVIGMVRKMIGATFARDADAGTIRGDLGCSNRYNLVHASDSPESAEFEIPLYFKPEEILEYNFSDEEWPSIPNRT